MKMVHRAVAVPDAETIGRRDRFCDPRFRAAHGFFERLAFGQIGRDRRRQRASGAVGVLCRNSRRGQRQDVAAMKEIVDALRAFAVAALDQDRLRATGHQPLALTNDSGLIGRERLAEEYGSLWQIGRHQRSKRKEVTKQSGHGIT